MRHKIYEMEFRQVNLFVFSNVNVIYNKYKRGKHQYLNSPFLLHDNERKGIEKYNKNNS